MKAMTFLLWICRENATGEELLMIDVPTEGTEEWEQNEDWWKHQIGALPEKTVPAGRYMAIYESQYFDNKESFMYGEDYKRIEPDVTLTFKEDGKHVWLYRIDEDLTLSDTERTTLKGTLHAVYKTWRRYPGMNNGKSEVHNLYSQDIDTIINIHDRL